MPAAGPVTCDCCAHGRRRHRVVAIVPCHNEEAAVGKVVADLRASLPGIEVFVYDNVSTDKTVEEAMRAGATVRTEALKGKGNVVRRAFADIDADVYLLIDGDDTYDASAAPLMVKTLLSGPYDHVLGLREPVSDARQAYRPAHQLGNRVLNRIVGLIFGADVGDMLSGYRAFSRRFVKSFPAVSREFEIETELTVHCLALRIPSTSLQVGFRDRAEGSASKLRTYRDGWRILRLILDLARHERPVAFYGTLGLLAALTAFVLGLPVALEYFRTGLVPRFPTLFVSIALLGVSAIMATAGLVLDGLRKARHEAGRLTYLMHEAVSDECLDGPGLSSADGRAGRPADRPAVVLETTDLAIAGLAGQGPAARRAAASKAYQAGFADPSLRRSPK